MRLEQKTTPKHMSEVHQAAVVSRVVSDDDCAKSKLLRSVVSPVLRRSEIIPRITDTFELQICGPIHFLIAKKAIVSWEKELIDGILTNAPDSILDVARIAQKKGIIRLQVMNTLESLHPSIPYKLRCSYLLLHAYKGMNSRKHFMTWLETLSLVEGTNSVLAQVWEEYDLLVHEVSLKFSSDEGLQEFGYLLHIQPSMIKHIIAKCLSTSHALKKLLLNWFEHSFNGGHPTTLCAFESRLYEDPMVAKELAGKVDEFCTEILTSNSTEVKIIHQTTGVHLMDGSSALLEVQVEGDPKGYEWCHYERIISTQKHHILDLPAADLTSEGDYRCKVWMNDIQVMSNPIHVTINTSLDKHQQILIDRYTAQPEVPVDTWPPKSSVSFINLALIKQESIQKAGEYGRYTIRGDMDDIIKDKKGIAYDEAMGNLSSGARVLIEGRPGSGKTTFVYKFGRDWANKEITIKYVRLLFLIQLRVFSSDSNINLLDIIGCYCNDHQALQEIVEYAAKHNGLGLGFVLDGLDEYHPQNKNAFIFKLIRKEVLPKSVVIVASRPAAAADFRSRATRHIEVLGFLKPQIHDYIDSYQFHAEFKCPDLHRYLDAHPNILHMCYLPIHISMVCFLYNMLTKDLPETETEIYSVFTKFAVLRMLYRYNSKSEVRLETLDDLSPFHKYRYLEVCELAFRMTLSTKQVMRQAEIKSLLATIEEKELFGLITVDNIATMCGFQDVYTFLHLTFQEFLAAYYISSLEEKEQMAIIQEHGKAMQMKQVWKFYCGLVEFDTSGSKFKTLVTQAQDDALHRIQCSFESQQPSTCDHVIEDNCLKFSDCFLTSSDFTAMAFVISNAHQQCVQKVVLDKCTFGLEGLSTLTCKSNARLFLITTLIYHGYNCTSEQLDVLSKLACSLCGLKILDITDTYLDQKNFNALVTDFKHSTLEILKVHSMHNKFAISINVVAKAFFSQCSNFVNICFSGSDRFSGIKKVDTTLLPYYLYCNFEKIDMSFCRLKPIEFEVLSSDLQVNGERTTILSLTGCSIDDNAASCLARGIKHCTALEILNLNCNFIGDDGAISLADNMHSHNIRFLNLSCNKIENRGALAIAGALKLVKGCKLHLWDNSISNHEDVLAVMPKTDFSTFEVLKYDRGDIDLRPIIEVLNESCADLLNLRLTNCTLPLEGLESLAKVMKCYSELQSFCYGSIHKLTAATDLRIIVNALRHCRDLHTLTLTCTEFKLYGVGFLADFKVLSTLDISHGHIGEHGAHELSRFLESSALTSLNISSCGIGVSGITAISRCCKFFANLCELDISCNSIQYQGVRALALALKHSQSLTALDVSYNNIGNSGARALAKGLVHCADLTKLIVCHNNIQHTGAMALVNKLKSCTKFQELDLSNNDTNVYSIKAAIKNWNSIQTCNVKLTARSGLLVSVHKFPTLDAFARTSKFTAGDSITLHTVGNVPEKDLLNSLTKLILH